MEINGKRVVDATRKQRIIVTKRDTIDGDNKNPSSCAAARAAKRDIPECISARVHIGRVYIEREKTWVRYKTPEALRTEIIAFDKGGSFQPGEYELRPMAPTQRLDTGTETSRTKKRPSAVKSPRKRIHVALIKRHNVTGIRPRGAVR